MFCYLSAKTHQVLPEPRLSVLADMAFPERIAAIRRERGLAQDALVELVGVRVPDPSLRGELAADARRPAQGHPRPRGQHRRVGVRPGRADPRRAPPGQFEATARLDEDEKEIIRQVIEGILVKHEAKRWTATA